MLKVPPPVYCLTKTKQYVRSLVSWLVSRPNSRHMSVYVSTCTAFRVCLLVYMCVHAKCSHDRKWFEGMCFRMAAIECSDRECTLHRVNTSTYGGTYLYIHIECVHMKRICLCNSRATDSAETSIDERSEANTSNTSRGYRVRNIGKRK